MKAVLVILIAAVGIEAYVVHHERKLINEYMDCLQEVRKIDGCKAWIYGENK